MICNIKYHKSFLKNHMHNYQILFWHSIKITNFQLLTTNNILHISQNIFLKQTNKIHTHNLSYMKQYYLSQSCVPLTMKMLYITYDTAEYHLVVLINNYMTVVIKKYNFVYMRTSVNNNINIQVRNPHYKMNLDKINY